MLHDLKEIFEANSLAVVGASPSPEKIGHGLLKSVIEHDFKGSVYPVNPKYHEILALKCYPSILSIPGTVDIVFFVLPASSVISVLEECKEKGAKAIVVISAGFSEASEEGAKLELSLVERAKDFGIRILGPNTTGFVSASRSLVASINHFDLWRAGNIAIGGQTGIFAGAYMDEVMSLAHQHLGYELSVSLGNMADIEESDFLDYAGLRSEVKVVQLYLESIKNPDRFFASVARLRQSGKQVIFLRGGRTDLGQKSTRAHTGSLGLDPRFSDEYLESRGVIPARDIEEFFDIAKGFSYQPIPKGKRVGIVTMSGANGTLAADAADDFKLEFPNLSEETLRTLKKLVPFDQHLGNPADIGFVMTTGKQVRKTSMQAMLDDNGIDSLLMIDLAVSNSDYKDVRETYAELDPKGKPIFLVLQGGRTKEKWLAELEDLKLPVYPTPRRALRVIQAMCNFVGST